MSHNLLYMKVLLPNYTQDELLSFVVWTPRGSWTLVKSLAWEILVAKDGYSDYDSIKDHGRCKLFYGKSQQLELLTIKPSNSLDLVHIDFINMETMIPTKKKASNTKNLSRNQSFYEVHAGNYFCIFGFPWQLMLDQAKQFLGNVNSWLSAPLTFLIDIWNSVNAATDLCPISSKLGNVRYKCLDYTS